MKGDGSSSAAFFPKYKIHTEQVIFKGIYSSISQCSTATAAAAQGQIGIKTTEAKLIAREFKPSAGISASDTYLKILRRVGSHWPTIIATLDIFIDDRSHIWLFQEFAPLGNAMDWVLDRKTYLPESTLVCLAWSLFSALDHLGTLAIAHNSIHPKHVLLMLAEDGKSIIGKLSSFRDALVYWDPQTKDTIDLPCSPLANIYSKAAYFRAPETFGNEGDVFSVVDADIWSLGASLFYIGSAVYPFNAASIVEAGIEFQIRNTVADSGLSNDGKYCLYGMMRTSTALRTHFEALPADPWFHPEVMVQVPPAEAEKTFHLPNDAVLTTAAMAKTQQDKLQKASTPVSGGKVKPMGSPAAFESSFAHASSSNKAKVITSPSHFEHIFSAAASPKSESNGRKKKAASASKEQEKKMEKMTKEIKPSAAGIGSKSSIN